MFRFDAIFEITLLTSHRDVIAAFKARRLFQIFIFKVIRNVFTEKCVNNAFEKTETFDG